MIILTTGSRYFSWEHRLVVFRALNRAGINGKDITLIHGACPIGATLPWNALDVPYRGADGLADLHARLLGWNVRPFPPKPSVGRSRAQQFAMRNQEMVDMRPDKVLAFYVRGEENRGTKMTVQMARRKNLWVLEYEVG